MYPLIGKLALLTLLVSPVPQKPNQALWNQWRGPKRDAHLTGFPNPAVWPKQPVRQWSILVGQGHSSPIIVENRAYVLARQGEQEWTSCIDMQNGKLVWQDKMNAPFDSVIFPAQRLGKAPRSTPLFQEGKLYTIGVGGIMTCFNAQNGKILWRKDFSRDFSTPMPICGASLSPLIDGKKLYVHVGHDDRGSFLALDKDTGKQIWAWNGEGPAYTSPQLVTIENKRQLISASHNMWIGLDPNNGALLWSLNIRQNTFNHNSITPVVEGNTVYCGANQRPSFALRLTQRGGKWQTEKAWETRDITMSTSSPVLSGNKLYAVNEKRRGQIVCMAADTGKILWACEGNKGESVSLYDAGENLVAFTMEGALIVYKKIPIGLKEVARYEMGDSATWASPAIAGNKILVKGAESLALWQIPTK